MARRTWFITLGGVLVAGLSWPLVLGLHFLPVVYTAGGFVGARAAVSRMREAPPAARFDRANALGIWAAAAILGNVQFAIADSPSPVTALATLAAAGVSVASTGIVLWLARYYRRIRELDEALSRAEEVTAEFKEHLPPYPVSVFPDTRERAPTKKENGW